jgi:hypothetical protein
VQKKQEGVHGSPQFSFDLCTRIGCHITLAMSPEAELGSTQRENGKFTETLWDILSLLGLLHKSYSDPDLFQEALGVLRVSHISPFLFFMKQCLEIFLFCGSYFLE